MFIAGFLITTLTSKPSRCHSISDWNQTVVHSCHGISFSTKNEMSSQVTEIHGRILHAKWKYTVWKSHTLCEFNCVAFCKWQSSGDSKGISGCWGLRGRPGWISGGQGIFGAMKLFWMTLWRWIRVIIHLSEPRECTTHRANCGPWLIITIMYQCWLIRCNEVPHLI